MADLPRNADELRRLRELLFEHISRINRLSAACVAGHVSEEDYALIERFDLVKKYLTPEERTQLHELARQPFNDADGFASEASRANALAKLFRGLEARVVGKLDEGAVETNRSSGSPAIENEGNGRQAIAEPEMKRGGRPNKKSAGNHYLTDKQVMIVSVLTKHHKYAEDSCLELDPISVTKLAELAEVSKATASTFFKSKFLGHDKYKIVCRDARRLADSLRTLNGEFSPHELYGRRPRDEDGRDNENDLGHE